jgi:hypothetical protein
MIVGDQYSHGRISVLGGMLSWQHNFRSDTTSSVEKRATMAVYGKCWTDLGISFDCP